MIEFSQIEYIFVAQSLPDYYLIGPTHISL